MKVCKVYLDQIHSFTGTSSFCAMKLSDMALESTVVIIEGKYSSNAYEVVGQLVYSKMSYCCFAAKICIIP